MPDKETSKKYVFNRTVIILVFICFAMAAFYFSFQSSDVKGSFLSTDSDFIPNKIDQYIFKKYNDKESAARQEIVSGAMKETSDYYSSRYVDNLFLLSQLNVYFAEGKKVFSTLNALKVLSADDKRIIKIIDNLHQLFEYNESYSLKEAKQQFKYLRKDLLKKEYSERMENSFLGRILCKSLIIQKRGNAAIEAGGIEAVLEQSYLALKAGDLKKAYKNVNGLDGDYHEMSKGWLVYVSQYMEVQSDMKKLNEYMHSDEYRKKFYKECKSDA